MYVEICQLTLKTKYFPNLTHGSTTAEQIKKIAMQDLRANKIIVVHPNVTSIGSKLVILQGLR